MNYKLHFNKIPGNLNFKKYCVSTNGILLKPCSKPMRQIIAVTFSIVPKKRRYWDLIENHLKFLKNIAVNFCIIININTKKKSTSSSITQKWLRFPALESDYLGSNTNSPTKYKIFKLLNNLFCLLDGEVGVSKESTSWC